jgi:exopolysaccharide/PEP-CTERM locus tyrosine autokinase
MSPAVETPSVRDEHRPPDTPATIKTAEPQTPNAAKPPPAEQAAPKPPASEIAGSTQPDADEPAPQPGKVTPSDEIVEEAAGATPAGQPPAGQVTPSKKVLRLKKTSSPKKPVTAKPKTAGPESPQPQALPETIAPGDSPIRSDDHQNIDRSLVTLLQPRSFEAEQFKMLRTNILFPASGKPPRSILITSALPGDGKSFVASNLAISFAMNLDRRVLLIDADIRKPEIHKRFGIEGKRGLSDFLTKATPLPSLLRRTNLTNLTILPGGRPPHNPSELLSSEKMPALLKEVTTRYSDRYVIVDSPPPKLTSETGVLARMVDGILLVVRAGITNREIVQELVELLGKEKILGIVLNDYDAMHPSRYYGYGRYGRYGKQYGQYYGK